VGGTILEGVGAYLALDRKRAHGSRRKVMGDED
jgi:hypothetical protein